MQTPELKVEISSLEIEFEHYSQLFDKAISSNVEFAKSKVIYHELRKISDRLNKIRELQNAEQLLKVKSTTKPQKA